LAPVVSLVSVHHLRSRAELVVRVSVLSDWVGIMVICGIVIRCAGTFNTSLSLGRYRSDNYRRT